jgi:hypothetical protein
MITTLNVNHYVPLYRSHQIPSILSHSSRKGLCAALEISLLHPPSQETPRLCGEECCYHLLRRDVALHARRMTTPSCLVIAQRAKTEAFGEGGSCNGDHGFTRGAPFPEHSLFAARNPHTTSCDRILLDMQVKTPLHSHPKKEGYIS